MPMPTSPLSWKNLLGKLGFMWILFIKLSATETIPKIQSASVDRRSGPNWRSKLYLRPFEVEKKLSLGFVSTL